MGHYSDYYEEEAYKARLAKKKELEAALDKIYNLMNWDFKEKYILPDSVRAELKATVIKSIKAELYDLRNVT